MFPQCIDANSCLPHMKNNQSFRVNWLKKPVTEWTEDEDFYSFVYFIAFVKSCKVGNDAAERSIKLINDFTTKIFTKKQ